MGVGQGGELCCVVLVWSCRVRIGNHDGVELQPGDVYAGTIKIVSVLGAGAFATVYKVEVRATIARSRSS
jgi:hypothetical protein